VTDGEALYEATRNAVRDALGRHGIVPIKHYLIVEGLDPDDGERAVWCIPSEDLTAWEGLGLLTFAVQRHQVDAMDAE
jgi:hypothetical protein